MELNSDEKKSFVLEYWRENVEPCKEMSDSEILESIITFAINNEFDSICKYVGKK